MCIRCFKKKKIGIGCTSLVSDSRFLLLQLLCYCVLLLHVTYCCCCNIKNTKFNTWFQYFFVSFICLCKCVHMTVCCCCCCYCCLSNSWEFWLKMLSRIKIIHVYSRFTFLASPSRVFGSSSCFSGSSGSCVSTICTYICVYVCIYFCCKCHQIVKVL